MYRLKSGKSFVLLMLLALSSSFGGAGLRAQTTEITLKSEKKPESAPQGPTVKTTKPEPAAESSPVAGKPESRASGTTRKGKKAESAPESFEGSEGVDMPGVMPEMPGGFSGEEKASSLQPPPEVPLSQGPRLSLNDCVQMALLNNREVRAKDYDIEIAQTKLKEAQPRGIPSFEYEFLSFPAPLNADHAVTSFFSGDLTFGQRGKVSMGIPLTTFGKIAIAQELAKSGIAAEQEKKLDKQNDTILKVKQLYYGLLLAKDVRALFTDANEHLVNEVQRREGNGQNNDPVELVRLKLFRYEILNRILDVDKKAALAQDGLRITMGMERGSTFSVQEEHLTPVDYEIKDFDYYLDRNRKNNPKNRLLDIGVAASEAQYRLEKRKIAPDVGLGGFYEFGRTVKPIAGVALTDDFNDPFNFNRVGFGLRIKGEINIKSYLAKTRGAQADYFKNSLNKSIAEEGLELDLKDAYLGVLQTREAMENGYRAMKLARQYVFLTKTNVDIGVGDKKDYSDALQAYLVSRGRYLESVFNYNVAVATLEVKAGGISQKE